MSISRIIFYYLRIMSRGRILRNSSQTAAGCGIFLCGVLSLITMVLTVPAPAYNEPSYAVLEEKHISLGLSTIPSGMDPAATTISLKGNNIIAVDDYAFANFSELLLLDFSNNEVKSVNASAFAGTQIEYLTFHDNIIPGDLPNLCVLNATLKFMEFSSNDLTNVPDDRLACLTEILGIYLDSNHLTQMPNVHVMPNHHHLSELSMNGNPLNLSIPWDFHNLTDLQDLHLNMMNMVEFPDLSSLPVPNNLNYLRLTINSITSVTSQSLAALATAPLLELFIGSDTNIMMSLGLSLPNLQKLYYYSSSEQHLILPYMPNVYMVKILYHDMISFPDVTALNTSLTQLSIQSGSVFNPAPDEVIEQLSKLPLIESLRLSTNQLTSLPDVSLLLPALQTMELSNNLWHCNSSVAWMYDRRPGQPAPTITDFSSNLMKCVSPPELAGYKFSELSADNFTSPVGVCPNACPLYDYSIFFALFALS